MKKYFSGEVRRWKVVGWGVGLYGFRGGVGSRMETREIKVNLVKVRCRV